MMGAPALISPERKVQSPKLVLSPVEVLKIQINDQ